MVHTQCFILYFPRFWEASSLPAGNSELVCAPPPHKVFARPFEVERSLSRSQARAVGRPALGSGIRRHRGIPRAQPCDVRSAGRDTWNLNGEALGGPRKQSWRRRSRARSGRRSAIRGAHSRLRCPLPPRTLSDPAARAPIRGTTPGPIRGSGTAAPWAREWPYTP